ncbi:MAG: LytTR family DNA-binding domain-containing protein [Nocardioidaceae bacterium]|nr:LytTR family DNA-binding domain-containing protein [Nocardioidaceae bacterium]
MSGTTPAPTSLRVLVVDDERPALDELVYLLEGDERVGEVTGCDSATEAVVALRSSAYDAVFLDVAMPGLSGLDLAAVIGRSADPPAIVFVTAHAEHAVDAFDLHAVDYLLKPVRTERLREAVRRLAEAGPDRRDDTIAVELGGVTRLIHRDEIRYVEVQGDYSRLHTDTGSHLVRLPISALEERWREGGFVRIHRSLLVALHHVDAIQETAGRLTVRVGGRDLPVSRRLTPALREQLRRTRRAEG